MSEPPVSTGPLTPPLEDEGLVRRPTGEGFILAAVVCLALVLLTIFIIVIVASSGDSIGGVSLYLVLGGLLQLGVMFLIAGYIVRAIWFLPGPDTKARR